MSALFQVLMRLTKKALLLLRLPEIYELPEALSIFHNSETFAKLSDEDTGLYIESSAYVYEILKGELKYGKIQ